MLSYRLIVEILMSFWERSRVRKNHIEICGEPTMKPSDLISLNNPTHDALFLVVHLVSFNRLHALIFKDHFS